MTIAVLGLGAMGLPMATNLATTFEVRGYDISDERLALLDGTPVHACTSAREAATGADFIVLAVRNRAQLDEVLHGDDGIADVAEGATVILTSTVGVDVAEQAERDLDALGISLVDAPVSGGPVRAGKGDLLVVVGAQPEIFNAAKPVLDAMASTLVHVGNEPGKGQAMKTVNQLLCGVHIAAGAEALALAKKLGLDPKQSLEALMAGAAESFMLGDRGPRMIQGYDDEGGAEGVEVRSRLDIFVKDMGIVTQTARQVNLAAPLAAAAQQLYLLGQANGMAAYDDSQVIRVVNPE
ncbi:NAD(P)-dependent oxidoreductase [Arcanobacterium haemolyticum]|nr:NAD(P)-dependent oxidoreductase [Arcanobacterium haemolyticum]